MTGQPQVPGSTTVGLVFTRFAILIDHYHLSIEEIGNLTDRQINDVYFHARDKDGMIQIPTPRIEIPVEEVVTRETAIRDLNILKAQLGVLMTDDQYQRCREQIDAKYGAE